MKTKINIFRTTLIVFILVYLFGIFAYLLMTFTGGKTIPEMAMRSTWISEAVHPNFYAYYTIDVLKDLLFVYALTQLLRIADQFIKTNYFSPKTIRLLQFSGRAFIIIACVGFLNSLFYHYVFSQHIIERMVFPAMFHSMTFILGIGLLVVEETYHKGLYFKTENELTI